ncbi:MAG: endospore germination permease [Oscillospiraceae bacterium]|nr:endospore germination permease [Oscillospiraceae bacterium]
MSQRQAGALTALFLLGNCLIFGVNTAGGRDSWIALLIAAGVSVPMLCVYARLPALYPDHGFFEIIEALLGRAAGSAVTALLIGFALYSAAYLIRSVNEFVFINALPEPPYLLFTAAFALAGLYLLCRGSETIGKWATAGLVLTVFCVVSGFVFSAREMDFRAFLPVLRRPAGDILRASGQIAAFPMLQSVLLLPLLEKQGGAFKPRRALLGGLAAALAVMLLVVAQQFALLGEYAAQNAPFPSYSALKIVSAGSFLSRLEKILSGYLLVAALLHLAVCLNAAQRGLSRLFPIQKPLRSALPLLLCAAALSGFIAGDVWGLKALPAVFPWYAAAAGGLVPLLLWIRAELRRRSQSPKKTGKSFT